MSLQDEDLIQFGKEIEAARRAQGLSASEVAANADMSMGYIRVLETGKNKKTNRPSRPSVTAVLGIARALNADEEVAKGWLSMVGYDEGLAQKRSAPARGAVDDYLRSIEESVRLLQSQRGPFMKRQATALLGRTARELRLIATKGEFTCGPRDEAELTQQAVEDLHEHLRAVSYQDEGWWDGPLGELYLENHAKKLREAVDGEGVEDASEVEMTRIFLADAKTVESRLVKALERHVELGITTYVIDPENVEEELRKDFVIYDRDLLREGNPTDLNEPDRKIARFNDDPDAIEFWLSRFEDLRSKGVAESGEGEKVLERIKASRRA